RLGLDAQRRGERRQIRVLGLVVLVAHGGCDDARRWRGQERLDETRALVEHGAEVVAFALDQRRLAIAHVADRLGRLKVAHRLAAGKELRARLAVQRIVLDVGSGPALPAAADAAQAMAQIEEETLALLLAVVADVDPG